MPEQFSKRSRQQAAQSPSGDSSRGKKLRKEEGIDKKKRKSSEKSVNKSDDEEFGTANQNNDSAPSDAQLQVPGKGGELVPIAKLNSYADSFQKKFGNSGKQGGTVKFTKADVEELAKHGFNTIESLHFPTVRKLTLVKGISEQKAELLVKIGKDSIPLEFESARSTLAKTKNRIRISTGSSKLDGMLRVRCSLCRRSRFF
jgi:hypothetical protein